MSARKLLAAFFLLLVSSVASARNGTITGSVVASSNGAPISGATVKVGTSATGTTNASGVYSIAVAPGTYTLTASKTGFITSSPSQPYTVVGGGTTPASTIYLDAGTGTYVNGTISANTTWATTGSPYLVNSSITIASAATLTVSAGVTVKFWPGQSMDVVGKLTAVGTSASHIVFTSKSATPAPGDWSNIVFESGANPSASNLTWVDVSYGGAGTYGVYVNGSTPTFSNVNVSNFYLDGINVNAASPSWTAVTATGCRRSGISVSGSTSTLTLSGSTLSGNTLYGLNVVSSGGAAVSSSTLSNNASYAIGAEPGTRLSGLTGLTMAGNLAGNGNGIGYRGGTITTTDTWHSGIPWFVAAGTSIGGYPVTGTLSIDAGTTVKFVRGMSLSVGNTLTAVGTSTSRITMTSAAASPAAGDWGISFGLSSGSSRLSFATVDYSSGIQVTAGSPTWDNLTVSHASSAGINVSSPGALTLSASTVSNNAGYGINVTGATSANLSTITATANASYAIGVDPSVQLSGLTGMSFSGNGAGLDAIELRGGTMTGNITWHPTSATCVLSGNLTASNLTVEAGSVIKVNSGVVLFGTAHLNGTAASPILFTANSPSPSAGFWGGLQFHSGSTSTLAYTTIEYAGGQPYGGVLCDGSASTFDHVTIRNNANGGFYSGSSIPSATLINTNITGNAAGVLSASTYNPLTAKLCWWGAATGPSGVGPGTGQSVVAGVNYEPWLTAAASTGTWFTSASLSNRTFNPSIGVNVNFSVGTNLTGSWSVAIVDSSGNTLRTLASGSGTTGSASWDGKIANVLQPDGTYYWQATSTNATPIRGVCILDTTKLMAISGTAVSLAFFSPNGDGVQDTVTVSGSTPFDGTVWTVNVVNSTQNIVQTLNGNGTQLSVVWDGKNGSGATQFDGLYTFNISATDGTASATASATTTLDNTPPTAILTAPTSGQVISNVYSNGALLFNVTGTATDANFYYWEVFWSPQGGIAYSYTNQITNGLFLAWDTTYFGNASGTLSLVVTDKAGNTSRVDKAITVGNFYCTPVGNPEVNVAANGLASFQSIVPFPLTEHLTITNTSNATQRTLVNAARTATTYTDSWNGKNDASAFLPDGVYLYVATADDGAGHVLTLPATVTPSPGSFPGGAPTQYNLDFFNNRPYTYNLSGYDGSPLTVALVASAESPIGCDPPTFCPIRNEYWPRAARPFTWGGVDSTGKFRPDLTAIAPGTLPGDLVYSNGVVVYGSKPTISNVTVGPPTLGGLALSETLALDFTTFGSAPATVTLSYVNQDSLSAVRTVTFTGQVPGHFTYSWDGRSDSGLPSAPGLYSVNVVVTDPSGVSARYGAMFQVQY